MRDFIGSQVEPAVPTAGGEDSTRKPMTARGQPPIVSAVLGLLSSWYRGRGTLHPGGRETPLEVYFLRSLGLLYLVLFVYATVSTKPHLGVEGKGLGVLVGFVGFLVGLVVTNPRVELPERRRVLGLLIVAASSGLLAGFQPKGLWEATPYFVGVVAAMRLERRPALAVLGITLVGLIAIGGARHEWNASVSVLVGSVPWFLIIRLMRRMRDQNTELEASRAAEARAAAESERGRVAREMHDVLAHSLSALALQLESTRLVARERNTDHEITRAIDRAHRLAAEGLEEARRAIGTLRGDELPGPDRLAALAEAFEEQTGLPVSLDVRGNPRALAPDARLALYRTAQEALTNVRRHATPDQVEIVLDYRGDATVLVVHDHSHRGAPLPVAASLTGEGGGYGLTGMRERAELLGGRLLAEPSGDGFRVELRLPA
jgi:signal transduction histidine kinase